MPWSNWLGNMLPSGEAHFIPTERELIRAALIIAVLRLENAERPPELKPDEWLLGQKESIDSVLLSLSRPDQARLWRQLGTSIKEAQGRLDLLAEGIRSAADEFRFLDAARIADAEIDPGRVRELEQMITNSWLEHRLAPAVFQLGHSYSIEPGHFQRGADVTEIPRSFLVKDSPVLGMDFVGTEIGRNLAGSEMDLLVDMLPSQGPEAESLEDALQVLSTRGFHPDVILAPVDFRLIASIRDGPEPRSSSEVGWTVPERAQHWFKGAVSGIPIVTWPSVRAGQVCVVDLAAWALWRECWASSGAPTPIGDLEGRGVNQVGTAGAHHASYN